MNDTTVHECARCDDIFTHEPVRDEEQVSRLPEDQQQTWCSEDCLRDSAEAYWTNRWSAS
jgi:hypothetical protein